MKRTFERGESSAVKPSFRFFSCILDETLEDGTKRFPPNFLQKLGCNIPNPFIVKVPNNRTWKMRYVSRDGHLWFGAGWGRFCKDLSLGRGYFIVWEYNYGDVFKAIILKDDEDDEFGRGMEIKYPPVKASGAASRGLPAEALCEFAVTVKENDRIPRSVARKFIVREGSMSVFVQVGSFEWPMTLLHYPVHRQVFLSMGWMKFATDMALKAGNVINFTMLKVDKKGILLKATVDQN